MFGLGLALAQPRRRVLVLTGDGEMLMGMGSLATIGVQRPRNLSVVVIDNERYGETGMQATHTRRAWTSPRRRRPAASRDAADPGARGAGGVAQGDSLRRRGRSSRK
jgi:thiamine pyrophosphate-dependent acetolactate synthase large subunit-like protein